MMPQIFQERGVVESEITAPDLTQLEAQVRDRLRGRIRHFSFKYEEDGLVLCGEADYFYDKQIALHVVRVETDLPIRANRILVQVR